MRALQVEFPPRCGKRGEGVGKSSTGDGVVLHLLPGFLSAHLYSRVGCCPNSEAIVLI